MSSAKKIVYFPPIPHWVNLDFLKQSWVTQAVKWVHLSVKGKVTTAMKTRNSRQPSQNLAPAWACTHVQLRDEKCFPWAIHHHHHPQRQFPHQGHWTQGRLWCPAPGPCIIDGLRSWASPAWLCNRVDGRPRAGQRTFTIPLLAEKCRKSLQDTGTMWAAWRWS